MKIQILVFFTFKDKILVVGFWCLMGVWSTQLHWLNATVNTSESIYLHIHIHTLHLT